MAESGHAAEVAKLRTASVYIQVYNLILNDAFSGLVDKDDLEFDQALPALVVSSIENRW